MLKGTLKDQELKLNEEMRDTIAHVWPYLTFESVQSALQNWTSHLAWIIENEGGYTREWDRIRSLK
jgi:hypothetical protein